MFTPQPDSSFRMAIYEPPELMINLCSNEFEERPDEELHTRRIRQEDSNVRSIVQIVAKRLRLIVFFFHNSKGSNLFSSS